MTTPRTRTEILNEYIEVVAKVDKSGHSGYARRLMMLMQELITTHWLIPIPAEAENRKAGGEQ